MRETKGKFHNLKVDKREFEKKDNNTFGVSHLNKENVRETVFFSEIWEKVRENGRN